MGPGEGPVVYKAEEEADQPQSRILEAAGEVRDVVARQELGAGPPRAIQLLE